MPSKLYSCYSVDGKPGSSILLKKCIDNYFDILHETPPWTTYPNANNARTFGNPYMDWTKEE